VLLAVSLLPIVSLFGAGAEEPWHLWVPGLAQNQLMTRALKGESLSLLHWIVPTVVCALLTALFLRDVAARLRSAAVKA
jgi:hypothetical protein